jgi:phosphorylcholine metabolism protein LicD
MAGKYKNIDELKTLYKNIMKFFIDFNLKYKFILFYGTLLGFYRENNFIENDDDIDVLIEREYYDNLLNYIDTNIKNYPDISLGIKTDTIVQLFYKDIGPFDIYAFDEHNDNILLKWDGNLLFEKKNIYPLKVMKYYGYEICIPNNTEKILIETYGKDWNVPMPKTEYEWVNINEVKRLVETYYHKSSKYIKTHKIIAVFIILLLLLLLVD